MAILSPVSVIEELRERISSGEDWYDSMLRAVRMWPLVEEEVDGERYVYLIDGEALDLLRLYERLYLSVADLVPQNEVVALIANDRPPAEHSGANLKSRIGQEKYRAYLSFIYGVMVEEIVVHAVVEELRKGRRTSGRTHYDVDLDDAYRYVYGNTQGELVQTFKREKGLPRRRSITLTEMKELTYWLFKTRLRNCDKSRVASDTKRALTILHRYTEARRKLAP